LPKILRSLESMRVEVTVDPVTAVRARASVERMLAVGTRRNGRVAA
jgi:quinolinate synthase